MLPFREILIPVDDVTDSDVAVKKVLELYESTETTIHLVFIIRYIGWHNFFTTGRGGQEDKKTFIKQRKVQAEAKLRDTKNKIRSQSKYSLVITKVLAEPAVTNTLIRYINQNHIDLIVIPKQKQKRFVLFPGININKITRVTGSVVLTVTPSCLQHPIKCILLPVYSFIPERKIELASAFAKKYNSHIYIITILDNNEEKAKIIADAFYLTYKKLKDYGHTPHYKVLSGIHSADLLLRYAQQINADMILLNPGKESTISGIINKTITDLLHPLSSLHVLMLRPTI